MKENKTIHAKESPLCSVFGQCGGCLYQDISYELELVKKEEWLCERMIKELNLEKMVFKKIVASPQEYHYRHRLDLGLRKIKSGEVLIGFVNPQERKLIEINECSIAKKEVSDFIPRLREEAKAVLPADYRRANLTVKTGDDGRVLWGGIGRRSHQLQEKDYLWTEIEGKRIHYSLDNFFQANHYILPRLFEVLKKEVSWNQNTVFFDLYGGVGLFSLVLAPLVKKVLLIEESAPSIEMAHFNVKYLGYTHFEILKSSVESCLADLLHQYQGDACVAMVDPPRKGLAPAAREALMNAKNLKQLLYLSCNPESLIEDLKGFLKAGWNIEQVIPFDFFPKTKHLEVLVQIKMPERH